MKFIFKYFFLIFLFLFSFSSVFGQVQVGQILYGENPNDEAGVSTSISTEGTVIAYGSYGANDSEGQASVYELVNNSWVQKGANIESVGPSFGSYVALSDDGNTIAIGAPAFSESLGKVAIYNYSNGAWSQLGNDILGENEGDYMGKLDISADGTRVVVGAHRNEQNGTETGQVRVFEYTNSSWVLLGQALYGDGSFENFGYSVTISGDGNRIAAGAIDYQGSGVNKGYTRIYELVNNSWILLGSTILGDNTGDWSGYDVDLNDDGNRVIIGAIRTDVGVNNGGQAKIYEYSGSAWDQVGSDINGTLAGGRSGYKVSLSNGGDRVAISSKNSVVGTSAGQTAIYDLVGSGWIQFGVEINGLAASDFQWKSELSKNGDFIVIGGNRNDDNGADAGRVLTFSLYDTACDSISLVNDDDDGETLRNMIECANNGDTIFFASSLVGDTLVLGGDKGQIIIEDSIYIFNNYGEVFINAEDVDRFCSINIGGLLFINNVSIIGGNSEPYCIDNQGDLTIANIKFYSGNGNPTTSQCILNTGYLKVIGMNKILID